MIDRKELEEMAHAAFVSAGMSLPLEVDGMHLVSSDGDVIAEVTFANELSDYLVAIVNAAPELLSTITALEEQERVISVEAAKIAHWADTVMHGLKTHGEGIVGHYLDTDENAGQFLRDTIQRVRKALGATHEG